MTEALLPCDVQVPPATTIRAGCKLSTLIHALELRGMSATRSEGQVTDPWPPAEKLYKAHCVHHGRSGERWNDEPYQSRESWCNIARAAIAALSSTTRVGADERCPVWLRSDAAALGPDEDAELVERLWLATKHGDEDHQTWLREAYTAFFSGQPVPAPRGSGNKEKRIAELEAQVAALSTRSEGQVTEDTRPICEVPFCAVYGCQGGIGAPNCTGHRAPSSTKGVGADAAQFIANACYDAALAPDDHFEGDPELQEIADGAYGHDPATRGRARDMLAAPDEDAEWLNNKIAEHRQHIAEMVEKYSPNATEEDKAAERLLAERQAAISLNFRHVVRIAERISSTDDGLRDRYDELIYAVSMKREGETRHETALRYIREREAERYGEAQGSNRHG